MGAVKFLVMDFLKDSIDSIGKISIGKPFYNNPVFEFFRDKVEFIIRRQEESQYREVGWLVYLALGIFMIVWNVRYQKQRFRANPGSCGQSKKEKVIRAKIHAEHMAEFKKMTPYQKMKDLDSRKVNFQPQRKL